MQKLNTIRTFGINIKKNNFNSSNLILKRSFIKKKYCDVITFSRNYFYNIFDCKNKNVSYLVVKKGIWLKNWFNTTIKKKNSVFSTGLKYCKGSSFNHSFSSVSLSYF